MRERYLKYGKINIKIKFTVGDYLNDMKIQVQVCSNNDLELLARLNKQLIEDEKHENEMNVDQLKNRMDEFLNSDFKAYLFLESNVVRGYALVDHSREPLYLRQFFVCRDSRRQGYGKLAFKRLFELLRTDKIDIEVLHWNEPGIEFWRSLGFKDRSIYMRLESK